MSREEEEMLEVYRKVACFTMQALEGSIDSLKRGISGGEYNTSTVETLKYRLEILEDYLTKIELDF